MSEKKQMRIQLDIDLVVRCFVEDMFPNHDIEVYQILLDDGQLLSGKDVDIGLTLENIEEGD